MEVILTEGFKEDLLSMVTSEKVFDQIAKIVYETLPTIPTIGSSDLPASIIQIYGKSVRRVPVSPFLIIYEHNEAHQRIHVYGLMHEKQAY